MTSPYDVAPDRSFWKHAVATRHDGRQLADDEHPLIRAGERVASAGSCFAAAMIPVLDELGISYLRMERPPAPFDKVEPEPFGYAAYSAAYGNIYTPRQLQQLLQRAMGRFAPAEDRWVSSDGVIDAFRPGLRHIARSDAEFELLRRQHLAKTLEAFRACDVFVLTLGLTEAWVSADDGAVFPACPGTIAGTFDARRHIFKSFSLEEIVGDLEAFLRLFAEVNGGARVVLTVSPVPMVATATGRHVAVANALSKSILRVAADIVAHAFAHVRYFPIYELFDGPLADQDMFQEDRRHVSASAIDRVARLFAAFCDVPSRPDKPHPSPATAGLSALVARAECEDEMIDRR